KMTHIEKPKEVTSDVNVEKEDTEALKTFKALAKIPTYLSASFLPASSSSLLLIHLTLSQRDLIRKLKRVVAKQLIVSLPKDDSGKSTGISTSLLPVDLGDIALQAISPSGDQLMILRAVSNDKGKKRFAETWKLGSLINILDVTDIHGEFYTDDEFGGLYWSNDEQKVVYVAEQKSLEDSDERKFDYVPSWGEKFYNKRAPLIVVFNISANDAKVLPKFEKIDPGQVQFGPEDKSLIFIGYSNGPRRFGIAACTNRSAGIYQCQLDGSNLEHLSDNVEHARSPRLNLTGDRLIYLSNPSGGPHSRCSELYEYNFPSKQNRLIVPIVHSPSPSFHNNFPGIYSKCIPLKAFITIDGVEFILMHSSWRSQEVLLAINLTTGKVQKLTTIGCWNLFSAWDKYILASQGSTTEFHKLQLGVITGCHEDNLIVDWTVIDQPDVEKVAPTLAKSTWSILQPFENNPYLELIVHRPKEVPLDKKPPLIIIPHGGPHSVYVASINLTISTLVSLGYFIVEVNYTGSVGFGQDSVDALIGNIGNLEVEEVQAAAQYFIDRHEVDPDAIALIGGSHGGFISGHLIGKYPACVMRNPVLNLGGMTSSTDIPDWCFAELGLPYSLSKPPILKPSDYAKMYENSPISNIDQVKTPTLLMLGENDARVPTVDGLAWWYYLKGQGKVEIQCKMYKETGHSLDSIEAEIQGVDAITKFLKNKIGL
ncbi:19843_t:CDS:10, partial [Cetraspora pellucida]